MNNARHSQSTKQAASDLWKSGTALMEICRLTGLGKNTLSGMASRNRDLFPVRGSPVKPLLSSATYDGDPVLRAQELWGIGATLAEIRKAIGVSRDALWEAVRRHPELFPPRETAKNAPEPVKVTLPPLASVVAPVVRTFVPGVRLAPVPVVDADAAPAATFQPRRPRRCCWPLWGHQQRPTHEYCSGQSSGDRVYCEDHYKIAHARV